MVCAAAESLYISFVSPNISTSLPTSTSGRSVRSIMHMSMHMLPRCGAKPPRAAKLHLLEIRRGRPSA